MKNVEVIKPTGYVTIDVKKADGTKKHYEFTNLVVQTGLDFIGQSMVKTTANTPKAMTHMAVGTSSTATSLGQTALIAEVATGGRQPFTSATASGNTVTYVAEFLAGEGTGVLTEAGIFNETSAGTMLCRTVFGVVTKEAGDSITITWAVTIS